jgi:HK97 family phage portal protein
MRFFGRKAAPQSERKSAAFFISLGKSKAGLNGAAYDRMAVEGYNENVIAFACINKIAAAVASVDPVLFKKAKGKLTKIDAHDLLTLMESPNPAQSGREFMRYLVSYQQLSGNAYILGIGMDHRVEKAPKELMLLNPGHVKVEHGSNLFPKEYEYKPSATNRYVYPVNQLNGRSAVLHIKSFHPNNAEYGLSAFSPSARSVDIHGEGQEWNKKLIMNGARPSGALVVQADSGKSGELSDDQYQRLKETLDNEYSGASNAGKPLLLEGGLDWREMSINPKDMEFLEGKNSAARDIALAFGVPPQLLGIPGDTTYANYAEAKLAFWTETVLPLLGFIFDAFNRAITPLYGKDMFLWYDEEMIPALEPLRKEKSARIEAADYMTIDEKREAMGLEALPDGMGSMVLVPSSMIPLDLAGTTQLAEPGAPVDPNAKP